MILGLDIGPNSIGWAVTGSFEGGGRLLDAGVRVFPEGVANFDTSKEISRNEDRRTARGMRRQIIRRRRRRTILRQALVRAGLLPAVPDELEPVLALDPYDLRRRALDEMLTPFQVGRILLHLNQRRGFLSNARKDRADKEVKGMLQEISELAREMDGRTLGQHLANLHDDPHVRIRGRHTRRQMLVDEFDRLWNAQASRYPALLTDALRYGKAGPQSQPHTPRRIERGADWLTEFGIQGIIFFQRPLYWPKSMIGACELEPREKRCPRADRSAQRFRLLQEVNNLRVIDPDRREERALSPEERALLLDKLSLKDKLSFDEVRKHLGFLESIKFNLERGERSTLGGMKTDALLAAKYKGWHKLPEPKKNAAVRVLIDPDLDESAARDRLRHELACDQPTADALLAADLPAGYSNLSRKAIEKLLPYLEKGMRYMAESNVEESALHAAGYLRRDELQRRLFDELPPLDRIRSGALADLPNPVVGAAMYEIRKVVNAILREYGKPDEIHVEMARELKMSQAKRREYNSRIRGREADRDAAADYLREKQVRLSRDNITKYLLWKEQGEICPYTGNIIPFEQLFGGEVDIDHVLPYSRTLDDSQGNKVVCFRWANAEKREQTPHEWLANERPDQYEVVCQRARRLAYPKYRRFLQKELQLDDFIARQLRDTAYIARLTVEYLKLLVQKEHQVLGLKGQHTAELRHHWGLETILSELPDSPAWAEDQAGRIRTGEKNRADHRHHAIDAIVVALTDRSRLQHLARIRGEGGTRATGEILAEPWPGFRRDVVEKIQSIRVSHRPQRKIAGPLHKDTFYGTTAEPGWFVVRKRLTELSPNEIPMIRDPGIRRIVEAAMTKTGLRSGRRKRGEAKDADAVGKIKACLADLTMPSGVPIRKVRIRIQDQTIQPIRTGTTNQTHVKPGSIHHACLFEWEEGGRKKRDAEYVTMLEAARRVRDGEELVRRRHSQFPQARFLMSLSTGDMVMARLDGREVLCVVSTLVSTQKRIHLVDATDARRSADKTDRGLKPNTFTGRKVTIDPLGRCRNADRLEPATAETVIDPRVMVLARQRVAGTISTRAARRRLREPALRSLGAQFTAACHQLRKS